MRATAAVAGVVDGVDVSPSVDILEKCSEKCSLVGVTSYRDHDKSSETLNRSYICIAI